MLHPSRQSHKTLENGAAGCVGAEGWAPAAVDEWFNCGDRRAPCAQTRFQCLAPSGWLRRRQGGYSRYSNSIWAGQIARSGGFLNRSPAVCGVRGCGLAKMARVLDAAEYGGAIRGGWGSDQRPVRWISWGGGSPAGVSQVLSESSPPPPQHKRFFRTCLPSVCF